MPTPETFPVEVVGTIDDEGLRVLARLLIELHEAEQEQAEAA